MIQFYDAAVRQINAAVIYVGLEVRREKVLAFFVDGPLCDLVDRSYANRFVGALIRFFRRGIRDLIGQVCPVNTVFPSRGVTLSGHTSRISSRKA